MAMTDDELLRRLSNTSIPALGSTRVEPSDDEPANWVAEGLKGLASGSTGELADLAAYGMGSDILKPNPNSYVPYHIGYLGGMFAPMSPVMKGVGWASKLAELAMPGVSPLVRHAIVGGLTTAPLAASSAYVRGEDPLSAAGEGAVLGAGISAAGPSIQRAYRLWRGQPIDDLVTTQAAKEAVQNVTGKVKSAFKNKTAPEIEKPPTFEERTAAFRAARDAGVVPESVPPNPTVQTESVVPAAIPEPPVKVDALAHKKTLVLEDLGQVRWNDPTKDYSKEQKFADDYIDYLHTGGKKPKSASSPVFKPIADRIDETYKLINEAEGQAMKAPKAAPASATAAVKKAEETAANAGVADPNPLSPEGVPPNPVQSVEAQIATAKAERDTLRAQAGLPPVAEPVIENVPRGTPMPDLTVPAVQPPAYEGQGIAIEPTEVLPPRYQPEYPQLPENPSQLIPGWAQRMARSQTAIRMPGEVADIPAVRDLTQYGEAGIPVAPTETNPFRQAPRQITSEYPEYGPATTGPLPAWAMRTASEATPVEPLPMAASGASEFAVPPAPIIEVDPKLALKVKAVDDIHKLARAVGIEADAKKNPLFSEFTSKITSKEDAEGNLILGKEHLDDMTPEEKGKVSTALQAIQQEVSRGNVRMTELRNKYNNIIDRPEHLAKLPLDEDAMRVLMEHETKPGTKENLLEDNIGPLRAIANNHKIFPYLPKDYQQKIKSVVEAYDSALSMGSIDRVTPIELKYDKMLAQWERDGKSTENVIKWLVTRYKQLNPRNITASKAPTEEQVLEEVEGTTIHQRSGGGNKNAVIEQKVIGDRIEDLVGDKTKSDALLEAAIRGNVKTDSMSIAGMVAKQKEASQSQSSTAELPSKKQRTLKPITLRPKSYIGPIVAGMGTQQVISSLTGQDDEVF